MDTYLSLSLKESDLTVCFNHVDCSADNDDDDVDNNADDDDDGDHNNASRRFEDINACHPDEDGEALAMPSASISTISFVI